MYSFFALLFLTSSLGVCAEPARLSSHMLEWLRLNRFLYLGSYDGVALKKTKVAVFGSRFAGSGQYLPKSAEYFLENHSASPRFESSRTDDTDRRLAQALWAITGYDDSNAPIIRLYNAKGPLNFSKAIQSASEWGADVVLNTVQFEGFGNGDGTGPINSQIEKLSRDGTLWVQSAGNNEGHVIDAPVDCVKANAGDFVRFGNAYFRGFLLHADAQEISVSLSYNRWPRRREVSGTDGDLDLLVYDTNGKELLGSSKNRQILDGAPETEDTSLFPFEEVNLKLGKQSDKAKPYRIFVKCVSGNFDRARDRLKLVVKTDKAASSDADGEEKSPLELLEPEGSSLLVPADVSSHYGITVGELSRFSSKGTTQDLGARLVGKPDLVLEKALVEFSDGATLEGPDLAAAEFAAAVTLMRAKAPDLQPKHLRALISYNALKRTLAGELPADSTRAQGKVLRQLDGWVFREDAHQNHSLPWYLLKDLPKSLLALKQGSDGSSEVVELGLNVSPVTLDYFSKQSLLNRENAEYYAFYLYKNGKVGKHTLSGYVLLKSDVAAGKYPWTVFGGKAEDFYRLHLMETSPQDSRLRTNSRLWITTDAGELVKWLRENP